MFAGFSPNKSKALVVGATEARVLRQNLIAGNIANIDTPFYKARDVDFETALAQQKREIYKLGSEKNEPKLELAKTNEKHFDALELFPKAINPTIFLRDGHMARNDANTVDLDIETSELSKKFLRHSCKATAKIAQNTATPSPSPLTLREFIA